MGAGFSRLQLRRMIRRGTRFSRRARRQTEQTRAATSTTEAFPTPANGTRTETDVAGHQIPAPEQTRVASITEACPAPASVTRTETDTAGTGQGSSHNQPGECRSACSYTYSNRLNLI